MAGSHQKTNRQIEPQTKYTSFPEKTQKQTLGGPPWYFNMHKRLPVTLSHAHFTATKKGHVRRCLQGKDRAEAMHSPTRRVKWQSKHIRGQTSNVPKVGTQEGSPRQPFCWATKPSKTLVPAGLYSHITRRARTHRQATDALPSTVTPSPRASLLEA